MIAVTTLIAIGTMAASTFGPAGILWTFGLVLPVIVVGNELNHEICPRLVAWLDFLSFRCKLGISLGGFVVFCLLSIGTVALLPIDFQGDLTGFEKRALLATVMLPLAGLSPLFSFAALRESREMRVRRGDFIPTKRI